MRKKTSNRACKLPAKDDPARYIVVEVPRCLGCGSTRLLAYAKKREGRFCQCQQCGRKVILIEE